MTRMKTRLLVSAASMAFCGCATVGASDSEPAKATAQAAPMVIVEAMESNGSWPPAGCPTADELRAWRANPANSGFEADLGLYSGDDAATNDGNIFWLGFGHGTNVQPPNTPTSVPVTAQGQGFVLRWNISDTVIVGNKRASQTVSSHYAWDYDAARDGNYAVNAIAINKCTAEGAPPNQTFACEQPLFGKAAWQADEAGGNFELCPPIILSEDANSVYVYDRNDNNVVEVYDYSLALILNAGGQKAGIRVIIDPKVENGGVGNR